MDKKAHSFPGLMGPILTERGSKTTDIPLVEVKGEKPQGTARSSLIFLVGSLAGGAFVSMVLRMLGGVLQGRLVSPATLGLFNGIGLVRGYVPFCQFGILDGLYRELPFYVGKGDHQRVKELAAAAQAWALAVGGVICAVLFCVATWQLTQGEMLLATGWFTNGILVMIYFYNFYYLQPTYRTAHDFARLSFVNVIESILGLLLLALVAWLNFYGMCLRALLIGAIGTAILFYLRPIRVGPKWNTQYLKHLLLIGAPIFGVGQLFSWWPVLNSTLILKFTGTEGLGLYSMAIMSGAALDIIPSSLKQVTYPRMAEQYGRNISVRDLLRIILKPNIATAIGMIPIIAVAWWSVGPVMRMVVPAYAGAVPAMQWTLLMPLIGSFESITNVFNVCRRQDLYAISIVLGMVVYIASLLWLIHDNVSLVAFSQAMLAGRFVAMACCYAFVVYLNCNERR